MIIRSKAPLRLGLAGGGTDVSPYCDIYSGMILNATVTMFAYASIEPLDKDNKIVLNSIDRNKLIETPLTKKLDMDGNLDLLKGVYNRIVRDFTKNRWHLNLPHMWMFLRAQDLALLLRLLSQY